MIYSTNTYLTIFFSFYIPKNIIKYCTKYEIFICCMDKKKIIQYMTNEYFSPFSWYLYSKWIMLSITTLIISNVNFGNISSKVRLKLYTAHHRRNETCPNFKFFVFFFYFLVSRRETTKLLINIVSLWIFRLLMYLNKGKITNYRSTKEERKWATLWHN